MTKPLKPINLTLDSVTITDVENHKRITDKALNKDLDNLNKFADSNDILGMTKRINGGTIGLEDRQRHYQHALHVFGA